MYIVVFNIENIRSHLGGGCEIEWIFYFKDTKVNIDSYSEYVQHKLGTDVTASELHMDQIRFFSLHNKIKYQ